MFSYLTFHLSYLYLTRNTHAHLCIAPVCRLRAGVICGCRWGVHGTCWPRRTCLVLVVSKLQWPSCAVISDLHLHRQRTLSSTHLSQAYLNVSDCLTHIRMAYTYGMKQHSVWHSWAWPTTYVHTYFVRIDPRFRASCSAIISFHWRGLCSVHISYFWGQHSYWFLWSFSFPVSQSYFL